MKTPHRSHLTLALAVLAMPAHAQSDDPLRVMSAFSPSDTAGPPYAAAVESFEAETGLTVENEFSGTEELDTAYEMSVLAGQQPDVLALNLYDKALTFTETGATLPVNDLLDEWGLRDRIDPTALENWTDEEGRVHAFPYRGFTWPVWYNTALLAEAGIEAPPETFDELIAAAEALDAAGLHAVSIGGSDWSGQKLFFQIMQLSMEREEAERVMEEGGYCDSEQAMGGIEDFVRLRDAGVFIDDAEGLTHDNMQSAFYTGEAAIMPAGSWSFSAAPEEQLEDIHFGGFPLPEDATYERPVAYQGFTGSGFWMTPAGMERLEDVRAFVEHMYSDEVVRGFVSMTGDVPALTGVEGLDEVMGDQPLLLQAIEEMPERVEFGVFPDYHLPGADTQAIIRETGAAYAPGTSADEICASLDRVYR